tara:strand:+ start:1110 stop:1988 length:879 start_codon:yes stop_codon:yes gene_type:complete
MAQWDGKSKGTIFGYKLFVFILQKFGLGVAYFFLYFVAFYFLIFSVKGTRSNLYYFNKRLKYSKFKSILNIYKSNFIFGQTIIDKIAINSGLRNKFTYNFDGEEIITNLLKQKKGGILISAHVGNFEIAQYFFSEIDQQSQISLVTMDNERRVIKDYLDSISVKSTLKFIIIKDDFSHIFEVYNALSNNELICFTGDRYFEGNKTLSQNLIGKEAKFPAGPFLLGSRLKIPVVFVNLMKETTKHYHLYARVAKFKNRDAQDLLKSYTKNIEAILKKYPNQWFNYFDFWNDMK